MKLLKKLQVGFIWGWIKMFISRTRFEELEETERKYQEESMMAKAKRADAVMKLMGIKAESRKQIAEALCMEILGEEFDMQDKYSKATFVKSQGADVMHEIKALIQQEGVLTRKRLESKTGGKTK